MQHSDLFKYTFYLIWLIQVRPHIFVRFSKPCSFNGQNIHILNMIVWLELQPIGKSELEYLFHFYRPGRNVNDEHQLCHTTKSAPLNVEQKLESRPNVSIVPLPFNVTFFHRFTSDGPNSRTDYHSTHRTCYRILTFGYTRNPYLVRQFCFRPSQNAHGSFREASHTRR